MVLSFAVRGDYPEGGKSVKVPRFEVRNAAA